MVSCSTSRKHAAAVRRVEPLVRLSNVMDSCGDGGYGMQDTGHGHEDWDIDQMTGDEIGCQIITMTRRYGSRKSKVDKAQEASLIAIW